MILLPGASKKKGSEFRVLARRIGLKEVAASLEFPKRGDRLVEAMVNKEQELIRTNEGKDVEISLESPLSIAEELYGGMNREAVAALFEFQAVLCCAAVIDEDTRLYYTQAEVDRDPERGMLVWDVDDDDLGAIFEWIFDEKVTEDKARKAKDRRDRGQANRDAAEK